MSEVKRLESEGVLLPVEERMREYKALVTFEDIHAISYAFGISESHIKKIIANHLIPMILNAIKT